MKLEQLGSKTVSVVNPEDPVDRAIGHMWHLNIRHLPVVRESVPVGMVSERDVLFHVCWLDHVESALAGDRDKPAEGASRIDHIMTTPAIVLAPDDPIEKAARLMLNKKISAIPLATHNSIVGIVTETDFLRCYNDNACLVPSQKCRQSSIADHLSANVFLVRPTDVTLNVVRLMREKQIRHIPVLEDDKLLGIISDRDVFRGSRREEGEHAASASELRVSHEDEVRRIMSTDLETLELDATLADAAKKMVFHKIGALPVLDQEKLVGIITETDLLRALVTDCEVGLESTNERR